MKKIIVAFAILFTGLSFGQKNQMDDETFYFTKRKILPAIVWGYDSLVEKPYSYKKVINQKTENFTHEFYLVKKEEKIICFIQSALYNDKKRRENYLIPINHIKGLLNFSKQLSKGGKVNEEMRMMYIMFMSEFSKMSLNK